MPRSANTPNSIDSKGQTAPRKSRVWRFFRIVAIAYLVLILLMITLENKIVFQARKYPSGGWNLGERYGLSDVWFDSEDGTRLHGWLAEHEAPRGYLLFCHGNAGNVTHRAETTAYLRDHHQLTVFVFDYRGYGRSEGKPTEAGVLADAQSARAWLSDYSGTAPDELLLLGRSLGGAVAVDLAVNGGAKGLILERTFTTLPDAGAAAFPWLPVRWVMKNRFDSLSKIAQYQGPLLASHGVHDEVIPFALGKQLYDAAICDKVFYRIETGFHNDAPPPAYYQELERFLIRSLDAVEAAAT